LPTFPYFMPKSVMMQDRLYLPFDIRLACCAETS